MKLVRIYKRHTLFTLALFILLGGILFYNIIIYFVHQSDKHTLLEFKRNLELYIDQKGKLPGNNLLNKGRITHSIVEDEVYIEPIFSDTIVYSDYKKEEVMYRILKYTHKVPQGNALITLWQSSMDSQDLASGIILSFLAFFFLYTLFSLWWNRWFMKRLWSPFYYIVRQLRSVDLSKKHMIKLEKCNIDEFNALTNVINMMLKRIDDDYTTLRGLTETTSHELQTPLSIIKAKIELIQQNESYTPKQHEEIKTLEMSVDRLIRLNRFLLTIARINNNQFPAYNSISVNKYIDEFIDSFDDIIELKQITIHKHYSSDFIINIHPQLAEILISNLLSNAIRYNIKKGMIDIYVNKDTIKIVNTYGNIIPPGNLFARFNRSIQDKDSTGLGLSIVESICRKNNLKSELNISEKLFAITISKTDEYKLYMH